MSHLRTPKCNLDSSLDNQYYSSMKQQQTHFVENSRPAQTQHWYEARGPIGAGKIPGPRGNPHLIREPPVPSEKSSDNRFQSAQRYMKKLYDGESNKWEPTLHAYASPNWIGTSVCPGPKGNPDSFGMPYKNEQMPSVEKPNPNGALSVLYRNQIRAFNQLADERERQIDRCFTGRIYNQGFQEKTRPHEGHLLQ